MWFCKVKDLRSRSVANRGPLIQPVGDGPLKGAVAPGGSKRQRALSWGERASNCDQRKFSKKRPRKSFKSSFGNQNLLVPETSSKVDAFIFSV